MECEWSVGPASSGREDELSAAGVNPIAKRSDNSDIRPALENFPLPSKPILMRDIVSIHARHYGSTRF